ncbi:MAG TPA: hypothetical protein VJ826_12680 [Candidatus Polarisedimenticolaceae bacterium]|nr:hypothetical protein [Candidatus Polarisedimenticolaceae bacterium]
MRTAERPASSILAATTVLLTAYWILAALGEAIERNGLLYWCSMLASWLTVATLPSILLPCWLAYRRDPSTAQLRDLRFALGCWAVLFLEALPLLFLTPPSLR